MSGESIPTVFWPADVLHDGFCYGWANPVICIAGVLDVATHDAADAALRAVRDASPRWDTLCRSCGGEPTILGTCSFEDARRGAKPRPPTLQLSIPITGYTVIYYHRHSPDTLRFYSLRKLQLDVQQLQAAQRASSVYADLAAHDFTIPQRPQDAQGINDISITQFNSAKLLETMISDTTSHGKLLPATASALLSIGALSIILSTPITLASRCLATVGNIPLPWTDLRLKDTSAIIQQLDVRAEQASFFVSEVETLRHRSTEDTMSYSARYTNFFNTVWLILNDVTIGIAFGTFLCENNLVLAAYVNYTIEKLLIKELQWVLLWLDSWPAGLKLNTELSWFYSHTFIDLINMWGRVLHLLTPTPLLTASLISFIGTTSCYMGATMGLSLLMDVLALLAAHIFVCYAISGAVYRRLLVTAGSLWNLFRGKRYNVLRNRTDSWEYEIDQLLFGTILFTLLAFLFPTVLVYYALFAILRLATLLLQAGMDTFLAFMNHFPLFALVLRVKDPWRLPGGIYFLATKSTETAYPMLIIKNQPVPLSSIFFQYIQLWSRLARHYNPLRLLYCVLTGMYLAAIPRYSIRYNQVPAERRPPDGGDG